MKLIGKDWSQVAQIIKKCPAETCYKLQPELDEWISDKTVSGEPVPAEAQQLNDELRDEVIEAQFDNFPV